MISALGLTFEVGDHSELWSGFEVLQEFGMCYQILILLRHCDNHGIEFLKFVIAFLQLNQLLRAERSPKRPVGCDYDV